MQSVRIWIVKLPVRLSKLTTTVLCINDTANDTTVYSHLHGERLEIDMSVE
jgi:hypothetical protein